MYRQIKILNIGCHLSSSKGYAAMAHEAIAIGANTFQFFTRNPRGSGAKTIDEKDIAEFLKLAHDNNFVQIVAHAPYTMNPCSNNSSIRQFTRETMVDDLRRMEYTPGNYYNFHPGNHVNQGVEVGIEYICELLNAIIKPEQTTTVLLETMSGKGTEIGRNFYQLREIINRINFPEKIGICFDTCHVWDSGYDISGNLDYVIDEFDRIMGIKYIKVVHLNDSKNKFNSHKDRHEKIGDGMIGMSALASVINHRALSNLPFILETPHEDNSGYAQEIKLLKTLLNDETVKD